MPFLQIETSVSGDKIPAGAVTDLIAAVAETCGKPAKYVAVSIRPDVMMGMGEEGASVPCAQVTLFCIGKMGPEENVQHAKNLTPVLCSVLGIPDDRFYITFVDKPASEVAWKGTTMQQLFKM